MVASISSSSTVSNWADSVFSKLDTKNQGYIEKSDLQSALSAASEANGKGGHAINVDDTFSALDGDSDGKVTKSEMTEAITKLGDQLNAQFDASRVAKDAASADSASASGGASGTAAAGGPGGAGGPHGPRGGGRAGGDSDGDSSSSSSSATDSTSGTSSSSADYIAAADVDGDGTVSDAEQAAYDKKVASGEADKSSSSSASGGAEKAGHQKDPMRELAHALNLLKAYAENSGSSDASTASAAGTSSVSVEA
jgi:hypothetical protein